MMLKITRMNMATMMILMVLVTRKMIIVMIILIRDNHKFKGLRPKKPNRN